jgi:hypothetical protein
MNNWRSEEFRRTFEEVLPYNQTKRMVKLYTEEFYLLNVNRGAQENIYWNLYISGSQKTIYQIKYYNDRKVFCNCPDSLVHCVKQNTVCKHICFFFIRILKNNRLDYYQTKIVDDEMHNDIMYKIENIYKRLNPQPGQGEVDQAGGNGIEEIPDLDNDQDIIHHLDMSQLQINENVVVGEYRMGQTIQNTGRKREVAVAIIPAIAKAVPIFTCNKNREEICNDDCPICYDIIGLTDELSECPTCHNVIHHKCMRKWLTSTVGEKACVFCRSKEWRHF